MRRNLWAKALFVILLSSIVGRSHGQTLTLNEDEKDAFKEYALEQTTALSNYINTLCDKNKSAEDKVEAVELAMRLFYDEDRNVSVSSKTREKVRNYKVRVYLNHLRTLPYERVEITWYDVGYVSDLKLGTDGRYHGIVTIFQKFVGYSGDGLVAYEDVTQKNIQIIVDTEVVRIGDWVNEKRVVKLGDISVVETK
ncbi:MAG: hypothetical protein H6603_10230 [Flavobacteriales bacterium]|nr:hypothetical protein [Flavobacteriales bacterium]